MSHFPVLKKQVSSRILAGLTTAIVLGLCIFSCADQKNHLNNYQKIEAGTHLDLAREIELDTFLTVWVENTHDRFGPNRNMIELYRDSAYTYFGKGAGRQQFFCRIKNDKLAKVNYKEIDGDSIRNKFYREIIPESVKNADTNCRSSILNIRFKYAYLQNEEAIKVSCHYKTSCEFIPIVNEYYAGKYNIRNKQLLQVEDPAPEKKAK